MEVAWSQWLLGFLQLLMPGLNLSTQIAFSCRGFLLLLGVMAGNCSGFPGPGFRSHCQTLGSSGSTVETE